MEHYNQEKVNCLIKQAEELERIVSHKYIKCHGATKLLNKISAEKRFLHGLKHGTTVLKKNHLSSLNLKNLQALVACLEEAGLDNVSSLMQKFHIDHVLQKQAEYSARPPLCVDIVAKQGKLWIKVIARNAQSLLSAAQGHGQYGEKTLLDIAEYYQSVAKTNLVDFEVPTVVFKFASGVPVLVAHELTEIGIFVNGSLVGNADGTLESPPTYSIKELVSQCTGKSGADIYQTDMQERKANLDITAMICLVSNLTNGYNMFTYGQPILDQQALDERSNPALPRLKEFLKDKKLVACQTAVDNFQKIMETIGGENEKLRCEELLQRVTTVCDNPSLRTVSLSSTRTLNDRAKILFGTGDSEKAATVTANSGFVRAARQSGVTYSVFLHEARALTEIKEKR